MALDFEKRHYSGGQPSRRVDLHEDTAMEDQESADSTSSNSSSNSMNLDSSIDLNSSPSSRISTAASSSSCSRDQDRQLRLQRENSQPTSRRHQQHRPRSLRPVKRYSDAVEYADTSIISPLDAKITSFSAKVSPLVSPSLTTSTQSVRLPHQHQHQQQSSRTNSANTSSKKPRRPFHHQRTNSSLGMSEESAHPGIGSLKRPLPFGQVQEEPVPSKFIFPRPKLPLDEISQNISSSDISGNSRLRRLSHSGSLPITRRESMENLFSNGAIRNAFSPDKRSSKEPQVFSNSLYTTSPSPSPASNKHIHPQDSPISHHHHSPELSSSKASMTTRLPMHKFNASLQQDVSRSQEGFHTPDYQQVKPLQTAFVSTGLLSKRNRMLSADSSLTPPRYNTSAPGIMYTTHTTTDADTSDRSFGSGNDSFNTSLHFGGSDKPFFATSSPMPSSFGRNIQFSDFSSRNSKIIPDTPVKRPNFKTAANIPGGNSFAAHSGRYSRRGLRDSLLKFSIDFGNSSSAASTPTRDYQENPIAASKQASDASTVTMETPSHHSSRSFLYGRRMSENYGPDNCSSSSMTQTPTRDFSMQNDLDSGFEKDSTYATSVDEHSFTSTGSEPKTPAKASAANYLPASIVHKEDGLDLSLTERFDRVMMMGQGEFSVVYAVLEQNQGGASEQTYAVKRTKHPFMGIKERQRRFEEVEILRELTKNDDETDEPGREHIINLIDAWESNGNLYIMTEFCENGNLDTFLLERGNVSRLDEWRVWKIMVELAMGVRYIHQHGFLHLDLKPANIFITFEGILKIGDFGMAARYPVPAGTEREGDREYIAPEVLSLQQYDTPADIFSLGIMMLETAANIVLPDNGIHWQKLRSGDLTDAGRLSSGDLSMIDDVISDADSMSSFEDDDDSACTGATSCSSNKSGSMDLMSPSDPSNLFERRPRKHHRRRQNSSMHKAPSWAPRFMIDNSGALDKLVKWMLDPDPSKRPSADEILNSKEAQWVEATRKAGAIIYEGDYGPEPDEDTFVPSEWRRI